MARNSSSRRAPVLVLAGPVVREALGGVDPVGLVGLVGLARVGLARVGPAVPGKMVPGPADRRMALLARSKTTNSFLFLPIVIALPCFMEPRYRLHCQGGRMDVMGSRHIAMEKHSQASESKRRSPNRRKSRYAVTVVVPALNEAGAIAGVVRDLVERYPQYEVLVIDDGSTDNTGELAASAGAGDSSRVEQGLRREPQDRVPARPRRYRGLL